MRRLQVSPGVSSCPSPVVSSCPCPGVSRSPSPVVSSCPCPGVSRWDSMSSKGGGTALTRRNYRLASDTDKPRSTGIVNEKLLSDYLHHVFPPSTNQAPALASL
ncbi:E3 ubiquitin-protein ligase RNF123-like, partial [Pseudochaenichthys georgianus]|uniref:E3 ubiquitin-protein ligase RNF123-like n=1 Tax=Pseudochaenichthys georgianus TaxID=52239 RepID=UPI00146C08C0